ncbi:MAG TPA: class I SAM-dependent methyltransferase [Actinomycetota bacterium]|nr:class I SAM-dependent methyltransferase [Actinomycetota bacterium]
MTWDPETYPTTIRAEIAGYDELQTRVADATRGRAVRTILELGTGAGETASRLLALHADARLVGVDSSAEMLAGAARVLPAARVSLVEADLADPLPDGTFDLVASALAVHHLEGRRKAELFRRVAAALVPGGRFVLGDVVEPGDPRDAVIENEPGYDFPSPLPDQLEWLREAGLDPEVVWEQRDLAVVRATRPHPST